MNIEIKNLHVYERMSEETLAFDATVYIDGVRAFSASNRGCGGCNDYEGYGKGYAKNWRELVNNAEAYAKTLPPHKSEWGEMEYDLDLILIGLIENIQWEKKLKAMCKKWVVLWDGKDPNEIEYIRMKFTPELAPKIKAKYPEYEIVNLRYA